MKRGEVWTGAGGPEYAGKPRPVVIVQDDIFDATLSVTVVLATTVEAEAPLYRILVEPDKGNGLREPSRLMADKVTTTQRAKLGRRIGVLSDADMLRLNQAMLTFLGLAGASNAS